MWKLLHYLPRKKLSQGLGKFMHWQAPEPILSLLIWSFAKLYRINLSEAEFPIKQYRSVGDFFIRKLKPQARPLADYAVVHCADAKILQHGVVLEGGACIQAKGKSYRLQDLLIDPDWKNKYAEGYFLTYYLCPTDYHRVHAPVSGYIRKVTYVPGDLWPVHMQAVAQIDSLYCLNERVVVELATDDGAVSIVFVGATNVGFIELSFDKMIRGNHGLPYSEKTYQVPLKINKGDELGCFRMGSTVVTVFSEAYRKKYFLNASFKAQTKVRAAII
jgi:phosphatidylserine decarboxylase